MTAAFNGPTFAANPNGSVAGELAPLQTKALDVEVGKPEGKTFFLKAGWLIGPGSVVAALLVLLMAGARGLGLLRSSETTPRA